MLSAEPQTSTSTQRTLVQAFRDGLRAEMLADPSVIVLGEDLFFRGGNFAQVAGLGEEFGPDRVRDCPISEAAIVAAGVGAALNGMRPVVDLNFIDFALSAMDEIINQAAKIRYMWGRPVPLVIRASAGVALFASQHNNSLDATFAHTPGLTVVMPSTPTDALGLIRAAVRCDDPVIFLMHKRLAGMREEIPGPASVPAVPLGAAATRRPGRDATIITYGGPTRTSLAAADKLASEHGLELEVIDLRTLFPIDYNHLLEGARRTGRVFVVTEEPPHGGIGAEVAATIGELAFAYLDAPVVRITAKDAPIPHSPPLIDAIVPSADDLVTAVLRSIEQWPPSAA
jgi:pyruvate/2-oxoglutarate/acetoin dehydrogenase E1 component